jgi:hypothetical protein
MKTDQAFQHLIDSLQNPQNSAANQTEFNKLRLADVKNAIRLRPQYLPIQIAFPAAVQNLPLTERTDELKFDCIITGAMSDGENKRINLRRNTEAPINFVAVGKEAGAQISLDAVAGQSLETAGFSGIQALQPFLLRAGESLSVDISKPIATADAEIVSLVFTGYRVFTKNYVTDFFNDRIAAAVQHAIESRPTLEPRFAVCPVVFNADGKALAERPKTAEPRLIYGFRSTVANALVNIGFDEETAFSRNAFPIWALATEAGVNAENYRMLKSPIFLEPQQQIYFSLINSINGLVRATDGQIEILESTV